MLECSLSIGIVNPELPHDRLAVFLQNTDFATITAKFEQICHEIVILKVTWWGRTSVNHAYFHKSLTLHSLKCVVFSLLCQGKSPVCPVDSDIAP
jgi:hypothetical protein